MADQHADRSRAAGNRNRQQRQQARRLVENIERWETADEDEGDGGRPLHRRTRARLVRRRSS